MTVETTTPSVNVTKRIINSRSSRSEEVEEHEILGSRQSDSLLSSLISGYKTRTRSECKAIDAFLAFSIFTGIGQLIYCFLTKAYPYNTFVGVFAASVGSFVFAANARLQLSRKSDLSKEEKLHLIIEFIVCTIILNVFVANFIG